MLITLCCTSLLSLINIVSLFESSLLRFTAHRAATADHHYFSQGSTAAFNAVSSMGTNALLTTYIISIGCLVIRRLRGIPLPERRWSLGAVGLPINCIALAFLSWVWVFLFFPVATPVTLSTMNWNVLINGGVMVLACVYYVIRGRHEYIGPVSLVRKEDGTF